MIFVPIVNVIGQLCEDRFIQCTHKCELCSPVNTIVTFCNLLLCKFTHQVCRIARYDIVRMAEWSKAPDSRFITFWLHRSDTSVLVHECGRGFESHFWHIFFSPFFSLIHDLEKKNILKRLLWTYNQYIAIYWIIMIEKKVLTRFELVTFCVWSRRDNHYTTEPAQYVCSMKY